MIYERVTDEADAHTRSDSSQRYLRPTYVLRWYDLEGPPNRRALDSMCQQMPFPVARFPHNFTKLHTPGVLLGVIMYTTGSLLNCEANNISVAALLVFLSIRYHSLIKPHGVTIEDFACALAVRTSTWSSSFNWCHPNTIIGLIDPSRTPLLCRGPLDDYHTTTEAQHATRIVVVTGNGQVGLSHHVDPVNGMCTGDLLVGLFGIIFPFILRWSINNQYRMVNVAGVVKHK